jgi:DNA-binding MarR family transcriptional regulator
MNNLSDTLLGLFTEIAIIEHLTRTRLERESTGVMTAGHFGILNYFIRNHHGPDTIAGVAWAFQEDEAYTASKIATLEAAGYIAVTPSGSREATATLNVTEAGRIAQSEKVESMAPDFEALVSEIPREDLATTLRTLQEIRLTLDHLPDR